MQNRRAYRGYKVRLRASAMTLELYLAHCNLYSERSTMYVKDSWMFRALSPRASSQMAEPEDDYAYDAYDSYAVSDDPSVSVVVVPQVGDGNVHRGSSSSDLDVQLLLDRITSLADENMSLKRDLAEKKQTYRGARSQTARRRAWCGLYCCCSVASCGRWVYVEYRIGTPAYPCDTR